jgi:hypothetical protein
MKGKVYKLEDSDGNFYIGSTTKKYLCQRMAGHKFSARKSPLKSPYNILKPDFTIMLIEEFDIKNKEDILCFETLEIEKHLDNPKCLNKIVPKLSNEEKIILGRERALQQYYKNHEENKLRQKKYYEDNREEMNLRSREYHKEHREERLEYMRKKRLLV